jgi:hypothetical protein
LRIVEAISNQIPDSFPLLKPWYRVNISRMYGESFSNFPQMIFPCRHVMSTGSSTMVFSHISPYNYVWRMNYVQYTV